MEAGQKLYESIVGSLTGMEHVTWEQLPTRYQRSCAFMEVWEYEMIHGTGEGKPTGLITDPTL